MKKYIKELTPYGLRWISFQEEEIFLQKLRLETESKNEKDIDRMLEIAGYFKVVNPSVFFQKLEIQEIEKCPEEIIQNLRITYLPTIDRVYHSYDQPGIKIFLEKIKTERHDFLAKLVKGYFIKNIFHKDHTEKQLYTGLANYIQNLFGGEPQIKELKAAYEEIKQVLLQKANDENA